MACAGPYLESGEHANGASLFPHNNITNTASNSRGSRGGGGGSTTNSNTTSTAELGASCPRMDGLGVQRGGHLDVWKTLAVTVAMFFVTYAHAVNSVALVRWALG